MAKWAPYMDTRKISSGSPFPQPSVEQAMEALARARRESEFLAQNPKADTRGVEQPWLDPVDTLSGGFASLPRGVAAAAVDMAVDVPVSLAMGGALDNSDSPELAMFIGKKGIQKLGMNPERDLFGQFSGLWDKGVRAELDDSHSVILGRPTAETSGRYGEGDFLGGQLMYDDLFAAYPDMQRTGYAINPSMRGGEYDPRVDMIIQQGPSRKTTFHEGQHAIQGREGMALGGTPDGMRQEALNMLRRDVLTGEIPTTEQAMGMLPMAQRNAYDRLAGEWEARNAGARSLLESNNPRLGNALSVGGVNFRAGSPFSTADDIALKDFIVRVDGGKSLSYNPDMVDIGKIKTQLEDARATLNKTPSGETYGEVLRLERELKNLLNKNVVQFPNVGQPTQNIPKAYRADVYGDTFKFDIKDVKPGTLLTEDGPVGYHVDHINGRLVYDGSGGELSTRHLWEIEDKFK